MASKRMPPDPIPPLLTAAELTAIEARRAGLMERIFWTEAGDDRCAQLIEEDVPALVAEVWRLRAIVRGLGLDPNGLTPADVAAGQRFARTQGVEVQD